MNVSRTPQWRTRIIRRAQNCSASIPPLTGCGSDVFPGFMSHGLIRASTGGFHVAIFLLWRQFNGQSKLHQASQRTIQKRLYEVSELEAFQSKLVQAGRLAIPKFVDQCGFAISLGAVIQGCSHELITRFGMLCAKRTDRRRLLWPPIP